MAIVDGLITLAEARSSIYGEQAGTAATVRDADIEKYVEAATPVIEDIAGPLIVRSRTFTFAGGSDAYVLPVRFTSVTSVTVDGVASTDYVADATAGIIYPGTTDGISVFSSGVENVVIVVSVGSATIPKNVSLAARELVRFWWQQGQQANRPGVAEQDASAAPQGFLVPRRVMELLRATPNVGGFA